MHTHTQVNIRIIIYNYLLINMAYLLVTKRQRAMSCSCV